ncbi:hypothetical protein ACRYCC_26110 [Actinomadura scrupuli]|uniref:hypothetical protein n=1 Tax=Actinomadura scrupuli TaxID=559629 RepID=UPI003D97B0A1
MTQQQRNDDAPRAASTAARAPADADDGQHDCAASGCRTRLPARILMCRTHWKRVPTGIQSEVYRHYRRGQTAATASPAYLAALDAAVAAVGTSGPPRRRR